MDLAPDLVARFRRDLEALTGTQPPRFGIAVSGGPDSLALLLLAFAAYGENVAAATVDHGLRPESAGEAAMVADLCARLDCPHDILAVTVAAGGAGLQGEARRARYAALAAWAAGRDIALLLTAHHAGDQAETILMRLRRGAGIAGLSGIRPLRREGEKLRVARPLLGWTRAELEDLVRAAGLTPADDPSNRDTRFDRVAMRGFLAENPGFEAPRLARSAAALGEANDALDWVALRLFTERCAQADGEWRIDPAELPRELRRRLLHQVIGRLDPCWTGAEDLEGLLATLESGSGATRGTVMAAVRKGHWHLRPAPPRRTSGR